MVEKDSGTVNRRKFMKRATAASAVALGVAGATGPAVARSTAAPQDLTESLLATHGDAVLSMLENDGVIRDRGDLPTAVDNDFAGVASGAEGAAKFSLSDGTEEFRVVKDVDAGTLTVTVRPGEERVVAVLDTEQGLVGYDAERGKYDFGTESHCSCTNILCSQTERGYKCCGDGHCEWFCGCR